MLFMRLIDYFTTFAFIILGIVSCSRESTLSPMLDPVDYVNTLTGTESTYELSTGNTYPAVAMPWEW